MSRRDISALITRVELHEKTVKAGIARVAREHSTRTREALERQASIVLPAWALAAIEEPQRVAAEQERARLDAERLAGKMNRRELTEWRAERALQTAEGVRCWL